MKTTKTETPKLTLESYQAQVKLSNVKTHYNYALALVAIATFIGGVIIGYFMSINVITSAQKQVVNSIELSVKQ